MSAKIFALFNTWSLETLFPMKTSRAMYKYFRANVKLGQRVLTVNFLKMVMNKQCGTNHVMIVAKSLNKSCRRDQGQNFVKALMREKVNDAVYEEGRSRREFEYWRTIYYQCVKRNSYIDMLYQQQLTSHLDLLWTEGKSKNKKKMNHLLNKWKAPAEVVKNPPPIRNIKYSDLDLADVDVCDKNTEVVKYGGVELSENMESVLKMNPKTMMFPKIQSWDIASEVEKGFTKARYSLMSEEIKNRENEDYDGGDGDDDDDNKPVLDLRTKTLNYGRIIATNLPTCQSLKMPKKSDFDTEMNMSVIKQKMMEATKHYEKKFCNNAGYPESNLTKEERDGIKEIKEKVKNKELFVKGTDKSGRLCADTIENYSEAIGKHTVGDETISIKQAEYLEGKLNDNLKILNRIFNVGGETSRKNNQERVHLASVSTNSSIPILDGVRKDHKPLKPGAEVAGPPVRPICYANESPNFRISHFLSKIINDFCDAVDDHHEARSSEEMRASWQRYNLETPADVKKRCHVLSMDVVALYPSMSVEQCKLAVMDLILNSELELDNFDWWEASKYIFVTTSPEEIQKYGLENVIPRRTKKSRVKLTVNCLKKVDDSEWIRADTPTDDQVKTMIGLVVCAGVEVTFKNHMYLTGDQIKLQAEGAPIGVELSCALHRPVMMRWDKLFLSDVKKAGMNMCSYDRYVDDSDEICEKKQ